MIANSPFRKFHRKARKSSQRGMALVVILACVVLLTVMVMAYFSYSSLQRQISSSSANQTSANVFAIGAVNTVLGDLKQEIAAGSRITNFTAGATTVTNYFPATASAAIPALSGFATNNGLENLIKISRSGSNFFPDTYANASTFPPSSRAINLSTTNASKNGRYVSAEDWNRPLLLARQNSNITSDDTPVASFVPPDWILVNRSGANPSNPTASSVQWTQDVSKTNTVIGRYAYAIYDEGGLLDANVAGYPSGLAVTNAAYKNAQAYADLTRIGLKTGKIDQLVTWRNQATLEGGAKVTNYPAYITENTSGFLRTANTNLFSGKSDQLFVSRKQLIAYFNKALGGTNDADVRNSLQYLTHFSRDINQPVYVAPVQTNSAAPVVLPASLGGNSATGGDKLINPSFPATRVQAAFTRNDGTIAKAGEPLVNKRFPLNRLAWVTYKGPSASRSQSDADIKALIDNGIPWSYLQQGTAQNIEKNFGLTWDSSRDRWVYNVHTGGTSGNRIIKLVGRPDGTSPDSQRFVQDSGRDPDFFELLKAGISLGSLGKVATPSDTSVNGSMVPAGYAAAEVPANLAYNFDASVDYHIIQIGANILSAVNPTSYPIRIAFDDGSARGLWEFQGVTDLPYLSYVFNGVLRTRMSSPAVVGGAAGTTQPAEYPLAKPGVVTDQGNAYAIQVPAVWNPYDPNGASGVLRPKNFRIVVDSNDPVSLSKGLANHSIWCAAQASPRSTPIGGQNHGLGAPSRPGGVFSFDATTAPTSKTGTPISDAVTFNDGNGNLYREPTLIFRTSVGGATRTGTPGNITSIDANPLPNASDPVGTQFAPLVLGQFPLAFMFSGIIKVVETYDTTTTPVMYAGSGVIGPGGVTSSNRVYLTYRLQYQDEGGNWVTYDTKYGRTTSGLFSYQGRFDDPTPTMSPTVIHGPNNFSAYSWAGCIDPRTARFGMLMQVANDQKAGAYLNQPPAFGGWVWGANGSPAISDGITFPIRPDNMAGFLFSNFDENDQVNVWSLNNNAKSLDLLPSPMTDVPFPSFSAGWTRPIAKARQAWVPTFPPGMYAQNNPNVPFYWGRFTGKDTFSGSPIQPAYYADADGVVRRSAGAYVPAGTNVSASTPVGLPTSSIQGFSGKASSLVTPASSSPFTQSQSRPLLLHRPFRTVAELGSVFRDLPWKNLDFFTPESGDAALLDLFCINETYTPNSLVAGKVDLNTRQAPVIEAIVSGAYADDPKVNNATVGTISPTLAKAIGVALAARTTSAATGPLQNVSELVGKWTSAKAISPGIPYSPAVPGNGSGIDLPFPNYKDGQSSYSGFSGQDLSNAFAATGNFGGNAALQTSMSQIQRFREAPVRALAAAGQTRVWNLLIDLVAQVGRYPAGTGGANPLAAFVVEGEARLWVHVSIDRYTGDILDKQIEVVKE